MHCNIFLKFETTGNVHVVIPIVSDQVRDWKLIKDRLEDLVEAINAD